MMGLDMFPWFRMPASGDVWQKVTNVTDWFSPRVEMNFAGDPQIEQEVNQSVASYGKQLGLLTEAVLALAEKDPKVASIPSVVRLKDIDARVAEIKARRGRTMEETAEDAMSQLKSTHAANYRKLVDRLHAELPA